MNITEKKILDNAFIAACISIFIPLYIWGNIIAYLPFLANDLNLPNSTLGFLFMFFGIAQILMSQIAGRYIIPLMGSKETLIIGILIFSISPFIFGLAQNTEVFLIASLPTGIALGMIFPTCTSITALVEQKTGKILQPLFTAFISIGFLFGAISSGIFQFLNLNPSFIICSLSIISISSVFLIFYFGLPIKYYSFENAEKFRLPEKKIIFFGIYGFIFMATVGIIGDWSALWFSRDLKSTALIASLAVGAWGAGESIGRLLGEKLINYTNEKFVGAYLGIIGCVFFYICVLIFNQYLLLFGILIFAFCSANFYLLCISYFLFWSTN